VIDIDNADAAVKQMDEDKGVEGESVEEGQSNESVSGSRALQ
jgi:hypothetical protein